MQGTSRDVGQILEDEHAPCTADHPLARNSSANDKAGSELQPQPDSSAAILSAAARLSSAAVIGRPITK